MTGSPDAGPDALALMPKAPRTLAEALDMLQPFLPTDKRLYLSTNSYTLGFTITIETGSIFGQQEVVGRGRIQVNRKLSTALFAAEADYAAAWQVKYGAAAAAEAEFGPYCARVSA